MESRRRRGAHPARPIYLPRAEDAIVERAKLVAYVLDPGHPKGCHKARVFRSVLGIGAGDWVYLREQLLEGAKVCPVRGVSTGPHGYTYEVTIPVDGLNGRRAHVTTAWQVEEEGDSPRLVTAYVETP